MDRPTKEKPHLFVPGGMMIERGYEVIPIRGNDRYLQWMASFDGPLVRLKTPWSTMLLTHDMARQVTRGLQLVIMEPVAARGFHDAAAAEMNFQILDVRP